MEHQARALLGRVTRVDRTQLHVWSAARRAAVVGACILVGIAIDQAALSLTAAFGALMVGIQDRGDSFPQRVRGMALGLATTTLVVLVASLVSGSAWLHLLAAAPVALASGLAAAWGPTVGRAGSAALKPFPILSAFVLTVPQAFASTCAYVLGAFLQVTVVLAMWWIRGSGDARTPVSTAWHSLAHACRRRVRADETTALRQAVDQARESADLLPPGSSHRMALTRLADDARAIEWSLHRTQLRSDGVRPSFSPEYLAEVARACAAVARAVHSRLFVAAAHAAVTGATTREPTDEPRPVDRSRIDHALVDAASAVSLLHRPESGDRGRQRPVAAPLFRSHPDLGIHSPVMQEAIRLCATFTVATAVQLASGNPHGYWIAMTVAVVSMPGYATTVGRTLARVGGTLTAIALIGVLGLWVGPLSVGALAGITAVGAFIYYLWFSANYALATFGISIFVLMLSSIAQEPLEESVLARLVATLVGAVIIVVGAAVHPRRSTPHLAAHLADYADAVGNYVLLVSQPTQPARVAAAAQDCRRLHSQVDVTLDESWAEPGGGGLDPEIGHEVLRHVVEAALYGTDMADGVVPLAAGDGLATQQALAAVAQRLRRPEEVTAEQMTTMPATTAREPDRCAGTAAAAAAQHALDEGWTRWPRRAP